MNRYFIGAVLVLVGLTLVAGAADTQLARTQTKQHLQFSDGGPIVTCRPGTTCDPSTQLQQMASDRTKIGLKASYLIAANQQHAAELS